MTRKFGAPAASAVPGAVSLTQWGNVGIGAAVSDNADVAAGVNVGRMFAEQMLWNPVSNTYERARTASILRGVRTFTPNVGLTVWTPAAGKKFRLMGFSLHLSRNVSLAVAALVVIQFTDGGAALGGAGGPFWDYWIPAASVANAVNADDLPWIWLPGNGYLSAAANNVLGTFAITAAALTAGALTIWTAGTEE